MQESHVLHLEDQRWLSMASGSSVSFHTLISLCHNPTSYNWISALDLGWGTWGPDMLMFIILLLETEVLPWASIPSQVVHLSLQTQGQGFYFWVLPISNFLWLHFAHWLEQPETFLHWWPFTRVLITYPFECHLSQAGRRSDRSELAFPPRHPVT